LHQHPQQNPGPTGRIEDLLRREGYWVWEGILTDAGRAQWKKSLQKIQP
jgi:hypothetical protein